MADRNDNLDNTDLPNESEFNPDLGRGEDSGMGGSSADRGSIDPDESIPGSKPGDGGKATSGDDLGQNRERARSGSGSAAQSDGQGDSLRGSNGNGNASNR